MQSSLKALKVKAVRPLEQFPSPRHVLNVSVLDVQYRSFKLITAKIRTPERWIVIALADMLRLMVCNLCLKRYKKKSVGDSESINLF